MQKIAAQDGRIEAFFDEPLRELNECIMLIRNTPIPIIAAVHGAASGGGCNLALACDLVVAGESARFNQAFVKIGLSPDCGGTFILPEVDRLASCHSVDDDRRSSDDTDALAMGMINAVVPDDQLMAQAMALAGKRHDRPPPSAV